MRLGITPDLGGAGVLRSGKWLPARALVWMVVLAFAIMLVFGPGLEAISHALPDQPLFDFFAKVMGAMIVIIAYTLLVRVGERRWPTELSANSAAMGLIVGLAIGVAMFAVLMAALLSTGTYELTLRGPASAWHGAGLAIESGVIEEVLVRGVVLRLMWRAFGPLVAFVMSAMLFGLGHIGNPGATVLSTVCVAVEAGVMLGAFYALTGRLWASIGVHAGWNFAQGYLFGAHVSGGDFGDAIATSVPGPTSPDWLTGGTFGPEASPAAMAVCLAVGGVALVLAFRAGHLTTRSRIRGMSSPSLGKAESAGAGDDAK